MSARVRVRRRDGEREREREHGFSLGLSGLGVVQEGFGPETLGGNMQRSHFVKPSGGGCFGGYR